ncbi:head assembly [Cyanophage SS120-1]|uniref:Scaffolding protein n=1 Tax=Cyanophage SS120-1 TaxID=616674 RepID=M1TVU3_9CAUD|nr:head assembly [Cyanophage SS120-1]AGG54539.1 scaffolding protein [Cyanophage SS120-1]
MAQTLTFDPSEGPTQEQKDAEAAALAQGEKLEQAQQQDKQALYDQTNRETENAELIGGKFKNQEELLKAYQELEKQRSKDSQETQSEEVPESKTEDTETTEESGEEVNPVLNKAAQEYNEGGELSEESIEELAKMDSKDLIKAYVDFYTQSRQAVDLQQTQLAEIKNIAGGEQEYTEMVQWASQNLESSEVDAFNNITNSGNYTAIKFAVEALNGRYRGDVGYEAPLVTGKAASDGIKPYRSQAELARDIADPRYGTDPAFRQDIEDRLSRSTNLL